MRVPQEGGYAERLAQGGYRPGAAVATLVSGTPLPQNAPGSHTCCLWDTNRVNGSDQVKLADLTRLRRARDRMDRDYAQPLDIARLARAALMSPGHFSRSFRAAFGQTPHAYLMTRRIERAKALLRRGDLPVTEVCYAVGFSSLGSFSSRFTELVGVSPSEYRARDHSVAAEIPPCMVMLHTRPARRPMAGYPRE